MIRGAALILLLLFIVAACGQASQSQANNELVLGAIYPLSGPQGPGGEQELAGVRAALTVAEQDGELRCRCVCR